MPARTPSLDTLGMLIKEKRGELGVRAAAKEVGISPATLSRVENGHLPDLENFRLICKWIEVDPNQILGFKAVSESDKNHAIASVHFKKKKTTSPETAEALAQMILHAQRAIAAEDGL